MTILREIVQSGLEEDREIRMTRKRNIMRDRREELREKLKRVTKLILFNQFRVLNLANRIFGGSN